MVPPISPLVMLVDLVEQIPRPPASPRRRGHPPAYSDRLFLKALVVMIARGVLTVGGPLAMVEQPTPEMQALRHRLTEGDRFPSRRTWERRLNALPPTLPARIGWLGRELVARSHSEEGCQSRLAHRNGDTHNKRPTRPAGGGRPPQRARS